MAAKKSNTSKSKKVRTVIPASERRAVTVLRALMVSDGEKNVTDEKAYQRLLSGRKEVAAKNAKEQEEHKREARKSARESARKSIDPAIMKLGEVRDLLESIEHGDSGPFTDSAMAMFARTALVEAGTELEQALFDLGVLNKGEHDRRPGGWFVNELPANPEAREASHG